MDNFTFISAALKFPEPLDIPFKNDPNTSHPLASVSNSYCHAYSLIFASCNENYHRVSNSISRDGPDMPYKIFNINIVTGLCQTWLA